jgi:lysophospholipase L1-like esterase
MGREKRSKFANDAKSTADLASSLAQMSKIGDGVARFISRAQAGENLSITCVGDSVLEGTTTTNPTTDKAMIKLAASLSERFGVNVTQTNYAHSGDTSMRSSINGWITSAINEKADLYIVSAYDKNDLGQDISGQWAAGYNIQSSTATIERIIREIRTNVPKADIILMSTNPFSGSAISSNPYQRTKDDTVKRVAATYGCEWVDCYVAFETLVDWSHLMADDTHPNTAGHQLIADTLLSHFPNIKKSTNFNGGISDYGLYNPEQVDINRGNKGYVIVSGPSTSDGVTYSTGGTGWVNEATSTVGDYVEVSANAIELAIQISTEPADATVVDIYIDDVLQASDINLSTQGKQGAYWIPFATRLTPANHKLKLTLKSGTLRTYTAGALMATTFKSNSKSVVLYSGTPNYTLTASYVDVIPDVPLSMPSGWKSMDILFSGVLTLRSNGAVTAVRNISYNIKVDSVLSGLTQTVSMPNTTAQMYVQVPIGVTKQGVTASNPVAQIQAMINDITDGVKVYALDLRATLIRTS